MPTVAACMIVRNGAQTLARAVASVRPFVDELCVYLAGASTDGTPELLAELAADPGAPIRVEQGAWRDDFADARARSFDLATADWLLWLDDDETLEHGENLRQLLDEADVLRVRRIDEHASGRALLWDVRAVRASLGARWASPVHEHLELPAGAATRWVASRALRVRHRRARVAGRHRYRAMQERAFAEGRHPHLAGPVAATRIADGRLDVARALLDGFLAGVRAGGDRARFDGRYLRALELSAVASARAGDQARARSVLRERDETLRDWRRDDDPTLRIVEALNQADLRELADAQLEPSLWHGAEL